MLMYLFGFLGAVLISIYVDRTKKFEFTAKVSCAGCAVCLIIFTTVSTCILIASDLVFLPSINVHLTILIWVVCLLSEFLFNFCFSL